MMRPRLMRSPREKVISGVCGGLAEYFYVDPVIVRLVFVLVGFGTGIGLLLYPILWMAMPVAPEPPQAPLLGGEDPVMAGVVARERVVAGRMEGNFKYDPHTGEPIGPATTGATEHLKMEEQGPRRAPVLGILLVGIGLMGIADAVGLPPSAVLAVLMIVGGVLLLRKKM